MRSKLSTFVFVSTLSIFGWSDPSFDVIPLGVKGGVDESNLSAYMVAPTHSNDFICLDAGTISAGLAKAPANIGLSNIKAYLISHAHLDHVAGLIMSSTNTDEKNVFGLNSTLKAIQKNYFNWQSWPNFADAGEKPILGKYHYHELAAGAETKIENTSMSVVAYPLSHSKGYESTAFLIESNDAYLLYFGDTGADVLEQSTNMCTIWKAVAPLVKSNKLKAIFLEASFPDEQKDTLLFGHLTPQWLHKEFDVLAGFAGKKHLKDLNVIVTHIKPSPGIEEKIINQLVAGNKYGVRFILPKQGERMSF